MATIQSLKCTNPVVQPTMPAQFVVWAPMMLPSKRQLVINILAEFAATSPPCVPSPTTDVWITTAETTLIRLVVSAPETCAATPAANLQLV